MVRLCSGRDLIRAGWYWPGRMAPETRLAHPRGGRRPVPAVGQHAGQAL